VIPEIKKNIEKIDSKRDKTSRIVCVETMCTGTIY